jgi:hypothetical protein
MFFLNLNLNLNLAILKMRISNFARQVKLLLKIIYQ